MSQNTFTFCGVVMKETLEDVYPQLYDLTQDSDNPDVIRQAAEIMSMLPELTPLDDRIIRLWNLEALRGKVWTLFDFYFIAYGETYVIFYPVDSPYYCWVSVSGRRETRARKSIVWWLQQLNDALSATVAEYTPPAYLPQC